MNLRQAAQQALEALENTSPLGFNMESDKKFFAAITALRAALAEAKVRRTEFSEETKKNMAFVDAYFDKFGGMAEPEQEPVAWMYECFGDTRFAKKLDTPGMHRTESVPLYTAPPQRKPLTDREIQTIHDTYYRRMGPMEFARAIEAAHGIGEKK